ncbi:related to nucleolar rRNA processing protein GAR1 [Cephalotrichum gorgonifer]|uniref:Related to nucleolar rRNA processing protein GAR1 n=1 Tax=Cephalotrichum gorgonifer TaxID=2041049 RepID=A0AAE8N2N6_9PEZI|nr:related to nucleolar rRNA processing protein GAR1 [Cephalotrichum gorgonifer]
MAPTNTSLSRSSAGPPAGIIHTSSRPQQYGGSFASRRGHSNQLSISDPSHHVTETIGTLYDDDDDEDPPQGSFRASTSRPLSYMASSDPEEITRTAGTAMDGRPHLDRSTSDTGLLSPGPVSPGIKKAQTTPARMPSRHGTSSFEPVSATSPTLSLKDVQDDPATSQFTLGNIEHPGDIAQELSNLQALRRMSMDVGNNNDPDMLPFSGLSLSSMAPSGNDDEGDPNRLLWVPARVHPELAPTEFKTFLESRVKSIRRTSGEALLSPDDGLARNNSGSLRRKKSMLSRQVEPTGNIGRGFTDGAEKLGRQQSQGSRRDSDLTLDELVKDPNMVVRRLTQESKMQEGENNSDIILPMAPGGGLRRSTRTTYRKGGSFSKRIASRQAEVGSNGNADTDVLDAPKGYGLTRTQSDPISENFSRPTRPLRKPQKLSRESNNLPEGTTTSSATQGAEETRKTAQNRAFQFDGSVPAPQLAEPLTTSSQDDNSAPRLFPQRSSSQKASTQVMSPADTQQPQQQQQHQPFNDQPPPKSSKRQAATSRIGQSPQPQDSGALTKKGGHTATDPLLKNSGHAPSIDGRANRTDALTYIPTYTPDDRKAEKRGKKDKDDDASSTTSSKSGWKWFKGSADDKKKKEEEKKSKAKTKVFVEAARDNVRLDVIQSSIEKTAPKGREGQLLDREREGTENKPYEEKRKESYHRKTESASRKEKDGSIFSSFFGGSKRKSDKDSASKKGAHTRRVSEAETVVYRPLKPDVDYSWTRFPLLEERAIYRMAHIKLANPRRSLHSQVLLSNFMYNYLAIVQAMHPQMQIPTSPQQRRMEEERRRKEQEQEEEYLAEQQMQQSGGGGDGIDRYTFDYHRDGDQAQYGEAHAADESVDYMDDTHIYEYDEPGDHPGDRDHGHGNGNRDAYDAYGDPRHYNNPTGYLPNGATNLPPGAAPLLPNQGRIIQTGPMRVLCIADVRGNLRSLNELAKQARADHIIHTGDFGFYDDSSLERIAEKTLKHVAQYSPLIPEHVKKAIAAGPSPVKNRFSPSELPLSELPLLLSGELKLDVPVYTVWGACEDVRVLERFRSAEYKVHNLHIIDEARSMLLEIGGVKLRLLGLGGAVVMHKLFDNGEGRTTIAGGQGTMWTTLLQMGELIDTANRVYDPTETRVFITHASPAREGILNQLSVTLKADFSISAGLHFRYGSSYNEFSVNPTLDHYRGKLAASKASFNDVWETVKGEVEPAINQSEGQQNLLKNALQIVEKMPTTAAGGNPFGGPTAGQAALGQVDESAFKNMWNFNLADAAFGWLVLEIQDGRIGTEMRAQGFNFSHRGSKQPPAPVPVQPAPVPSAGPSPNPQPTQPAQPAASRQAPPAPSAKPTGTTPVPPTSQAKKPATPQPAPQATGAKETEAAPPAANGSGGNVPEPSASPAPRTTPQDIIGLFIMNLTSDEQTRDLFAEEDKSKILKIDKWGGQNKVVHFKTTEERDAAMARLPDEFKTRTREDRSRPLVTIFQPRESKSFGRGGGGAGNWGSSGRGGSSNTGSGYRSAGGGGASDSEGARRGGRGGRGGRGERGRGRGRGLKDSGAASPAPSSSTPAPDS